MIPLIEKILSKLIPQGPGELPAAEKGAGALAPAAAIPAAPAPAKKPVTCGIGPGFELCASHPSVILEEREGEKIPAGITFRVSYHGSSAPISLHGAFSEQDIPKALSLIAAQLGEGKNIVEIGQGIEAAMRA